MLLEGLGRVCWCPLVVNEGDPDGISAWEWGIWGDLKVGFCFSCVRLFLKSNDFLCWGWGSCCWVILVSDSWS